jgi:transglutaminase-like putative cysteine protease
MREVAIPAAIALGAIGTIAAERVHFPPLLGFAAGALAAALAVLGLPSVPTRRATVLLLGIGGLGALRHASYGGTNRGVLLAVWAVATLVALVLVDRADAEGTPALPGGRPLPARGSEAVRVSAFITLIVIISSALFVPTLTDRLGRHVWPGVTPSFGDALDAPASLKATDQLDMTTRPRLSDKIVMTVDSPRADFWRGETFDVWDGQTWTRSDPRARSLARDATNRVQIPPEDDDPGADIGDELRQTFHIETGYSDIVFAAASPREVETDKYLRGRSDGTAVVAGGMSNAFGKGAVYTVTSRRFASTAESLRQADGVATPQWILDQYAVTPQATTDRVRALGRTITATATTRYDKVKAVEAWLGANTKYSLNAPLSPSGVDVVDYFLFRSKLGWCEQIASSLVVLLRSAGIPARLATGFVPGERDPLTGRFVVRERDAHAWSEVYFAGAGWVSFDPTASLPLAGDAQPGGSWLTNIRRHAWALGIATVLLLLLVLVVPGLVVRLRNRRARRSTWSGRTLDRLEHLGRRSGRSRAPAETPREYAHALAAHLDEPALEAVGDALDEDAYSARGAPEEARKRANAVVASLRP